MRCQSHLEMWWATSVFVATSGSTTGTWLRHCYMPHTRHVQASAGYTKYLQYWLDEKIHLLREA